MIGGACRALCHTLRLWPWTKPFGGVTGERPRRRVADGLVVNTPRGRMVVRKMPDIGPERRPDRSRRS